MISQPIAIASLVPGRVSGRLETDPARGDRESVLMLGQDRLDEVTSMPAGLIIVDPAPFSHAVIRWCGRGIPVGMLAAEHAAGLAAGDEVVLDTAAGLLRPAVSGDQLAAWCPPLPASVPARSADGTPVQLSASVDNTAAVRRARAAGAAAIGLVRSEYLVPADGSRPDAAFFRQVFAALVAAADGLPVTVRLLDVAADKLPAWLGQAAVQARATGLHGSQLFSLDAVRDVMGQQVAALSEVAGPQLRLMWPGGGLLPVFLHWREGLTLDAPVGAMLESPIEAIGVDAWLSHADFVAIGCNDLLQYLNGARRDLPAHRELLDPYRPELFRYLSEVGGRAGPGLDRVQLCGLLPQIEGVLPVLLGLGFRSFSVEVALLPLLARLVARWSIHECRVLAGKVTAAGDARSVRRLLDLDPSLTWGLVRATGGSDSR